MRRWQSSLLILAFVVVGCDSDNDEIVVDEAPLGVIFSLPPADGLPTPYSGRTDLSVTFNRATGVHEMEMSIFPPVQSGDITTNPESRRTWTWNDVIFEADQGAYFWLIDGIWLGRWVNLDDDRVFLRQPVIVRIPSSNVRDPSVGFDGVVTSNNARVLASGTLVFALPVDSGFNPLDPGGTFDPADAIGVALAYRTDDFVDLFANYRARLMPLDTQVLPIAVKDTNGDLRYSPIDDWWGMYEPGGEFDGVFCREDTGEKDSLFNSAVEIFLRPPVGQPTTN